MPLPPVLIELKALSGDLTAKVGEAKAELAGLESSGNSHMAGLAKAGQIAAVGVAAIGVTAIAVGAIAVKMASSFQESTTQLVTGAGESEAQIEKVRAGILAMAGAVGTMPEELSKGMYLIESAGYHGAQGLSVLKAAAQGAKVGGADMTVVANGLTTAMTDYHIPASRANAVTSALVATVAAGKMKMGDLASSLGMVMPKAAALGVSFQDVNGAMATMTATGMSTRRASMNLANTIMSLGAPSKGAATALKEIGLSAQKVKDDMSKKGLQGTLEEITDHVGNKFPKGSVAGVTALKAILGGTTGFGTALALTGTHAAAFEANVKSVGGALNGQTKNVQGFALTQKDLAFQMDSAKATVAALGIKLGTVLIPIVTKAMEYINSTALPAIKNLAMSFSVHVVPAIESVAKFISGTLWPAFQKLASFLTGTVIPAIKNVAKFISDNKTPIAIVAGIITALFIPAMIRMAVQATISGMETIAIWVLMQASAIASTATSVAQFAIQGAKWVWSGVVAVANAAVVVGGWVATAAGAVANTAITVAQFALTAAKWVAGGVVAAAGAAVQVGSWIATAAAAVFNAALIAGAWLISMGPIILVAAAVIGLGVLIFKNMDKIKAWIGGAWDWVKEKTSAAWNWIKDITSSVWGAVVSFFQGLPGKVSAAIQPVIDFVKKVFSYTPLGLVIENFGAIVTFVKGVPGKILSALGNLGQLLVNAGGDLLRGLANGITGAISGVIDAAKHAASAAVNAVKSALGINSPSKVFHDLGAGTVEGFVNGINAGQGDVASSMRSLMKVPSITPLGGGSVSAGGASGASVPSLGGTVASLSSRSGGGGNADIISALQALGDRIAKISDQQARTMQTLQRAGAR
jgi:TP901 family phage tail tape measure protein